MRLLDTPVKLTDFSVDGRGFLRGKALFARSGIQQYAAWELQIVDLAPDTVLRIYRPPEAVFDAAALESFASAPVTDDHPKDDVDPANMNRLTVGWAGETVTKDGDHVKTVLTIAGADAIAKVKAGKVELSAGYDSDLEMKAGTTPAGEAYDGVMTNIRGNHIALVDAGRCGGSCRITDGGCRCGRDCKASDDNGESQMPNRTIVVDGISIETTDQGAQAIDKLLKQIASLETTHTADIARMTAEAGTAAATHKTAIDAKDGEIAALKTKVVGEDKLDALIAARAAVADVAKKVLGDKFDPKGKSMLDIKRAVVASKLGEAEVKDKAEGYIDAAYDVIAKDAKPASAASDGAGRAINSALSDGQDDADKAWADMVKGTTDAWKTPAGSAAKQ